MSKMYPECPLASHYSCRSWDDPKVCAIIRKDKQCLKKQVPGRKKRGRKKPPTI